MGRHTIIINQSHYKGNGLFRFDMPVGATFKDAKLSMYQVTMYNSTFNITAFYGNNTLSIKWIDNTVVNLTIPDGYYSYNDINNFIQNACLANNWYVSPVNNTNSAIYFITCSANSARYAANMNVYAVPTAASASGVYTKPSGATWAWPSSPTTPQITLSSGLGKIFGFTNLVIPPSVQSSNFSAVSNIVPVISPVYSYLVSCNLLNSNFSLQNQLFFQIPINASFGGLIIVNNPQSQLLDIQDGYYKSIDLFFSDQNGNVLNLLDTEVTIILLLDN